MPVKTALPKASKPAGGRVSPRSSHHQLARKRADAALVLAEARRAGLLDGNRTEHLSFRAPKALIEAAKRQSGATRPTELGLLALAMLAQPDPTARFLKATRGRLGADHALDY
jgi:hypothetical protein